MNTIERHIFIPLLTFVVGIVLLIGHNCFAIVNYDNNPDLAKAMEYDLNVLSFSETPKEGKLAKADRKVAKEHYLKYIESLKNPNESFRRAAIYAQIAALYTNGTNIEKGEDYNDQEAIYFWKKVLEEEPQRYGHLTMSVRCGLASLAPYGMERIKALMDYYDWVNSFNTAEAITKSWLPTSKKIEPMIDPNLPEERRKELRKLLEPRDPNKPTTEEIRGCLNANKNYKEATIANAVDVAIYSLKDPNDGIEYILSRLPENAPEIKIVNKAIEEESKKLELNN